MQLMQALRGVATPKARRYLYGVTAALVPLAVAYGLIQEDTAALWITLLGAVAGVIAYPNTPSPESNSGDVSQDETA